MMASLIIDRYKPVFTPYSPLLDLPCRIEQNIPNLLHARDVGQSTFATLLTKLKAIVVCGNSEVIHSLKDYTCSFVD